MDEVFSKQLPDWSESNWTSKSRVEARRSQFDGAEADFADFTYKDITGSLTRIFLDQGITAADAWLRDLDNPITYHLEVKSTVGDCSEPFYMSNNQVEKVRLTSQLSNLEC
jgi:hypothetical protein